MANSFMSKVAAERRVLSIVNARFRGAEQLAGLSKSAIELWQRTVGDQAIEEVVATLIVLAELCQSLSDRSHESFKPLNPAVEQALDAALIALNAAVHQYQHEG
jgi:hypothetical protein